uniref:Uncharacterized protein n=1 Tax=Triticum urartu TaxID=4572 RepID=A0A8R7QS33_TRIUA
GSSWTLTASFPRERVRLPRSSPRRRYPPHWLNCITASPPSSSSVTLPLPRPSVRVSLVLLLLLLQWRILLPPSPRRSDLSFLLAAYFRSIRCLACYFAGAAISPRSCPVRVRCFFSARAGQERAANCDLPW